jgi:hypothetical protein
MTRLRNLTAPPHIVIAVHVYVPTRLLNSSNLNYKNRITLAWLGMDSLELKSLHHHLIDGVVVCLTDDPSSNVLFVPVVVT